MLPFCWLSSDSSLIFSFNRRQCFIQCTRNLLHWQALEAMCQGHRSYSIDMFRYNFLYAKIGCVGLCGSAHHNIATVTIYIEFNIDMSNQLGHGTRHCDIVLYICCLDNLGLQALFRRGILSNKYQGIGPLSLPSLTVINALAQIVDRCNVHTQTKAVGELRT